MRRVVSRIAMMLTLALFLAAAPPDDKSDSSSKKDTSKPAGKTPKKKVRADVLDGKLVKVDPKERAFTLQVTTKIPRENAGAAQNIANLQRQLAGNRDINSIRSIKLEIMKNEQNLITYKDEVKKIRVITDDDFKVRTMLLPVEYDDKGKPRKLTEKEKKALKGSDLKAPGYEADFESLKPDLTVEVYLEKSKDGHKSRSKDRDGADSNDAKKAIMIVIVSEPVK